MDLIPLSHPQDLKNQGQDYLIFGYLGEYRFYFQLKEVTADGIKATHMTPKHHYVDDLTFTFKANGSEICYVHVSKPNNGCTMYSLNSFF